MKALVINSGSSSVKFELFEIDGAGDRSLAEGEIERIGSPESSLWFRRGSSPGSVPESRLVAAPDHEEALRTALDMALAVPEAGAASAGAAKQATPSATEPGVTASDLAVVGHRVVHGGSRFSAPVLIDDEITELIGEVALLAPLHTKANLAGIKATRRLLPGIPQVAVFDTAFHATLPPRAYEYALPRELAQAYGIRRYGFHGTSHEYVAKRAADLLGRPLESLDLITLHLGNGASVTAIRQGRSVDTSMGMTPLEGLVMGTRSGDVDPAIPMLLGELSDRSREDVNRMLNSESGLLGLCGESDMREVHALADAGDEDAQLALEIFCYRAKKYVGAYFAVLGRLDALVFTAGIGENDADVRRRICQGLERLGITIDEAANNVAVQMERFVSAQGSEVPVLVIPTDEEREIARAAVACIRQAREGAASAAFASTS